MVLLRLLDQEGFYILIYIITAEHRAFNALYYFRLIRLKKPRSTTSFQALLNHYFDFRADLQ